jgi:Tfp pilus assembly protein PilN
MVQRINFAEKGKYTLTYRNMIIAVAAWFVLCFLIYMIQAGYAFYVGQQLSQQEEKFKQLNQEKDKRLAVLEIASKQVEEHVSVKGLAEYISHLPLWSETVEEIENALPRSLWLKDISSQDIDGGNRVKQIKITGVTLSNNAVVQFVKKLNESTMIKNAMVAQLSQGEVSDKQAKAGVAEQSAVAGTREGAVKEEAGTADLPVQETQFVIRAEVHFPETKWK